MRNICRIVFYAYFFFGRPVLAWNAQGHMLVAQIAYNHLDHGVKAQCDALIAVPVANASSINSNFVTAACWADDIKSFTSAYNNWHFIDIPFSLDGTPTNGVANDPSNVVWAINQSIATLQDHNATQSNQAVALRFLIHFVGDIQQPLHASTAVWSTETGGDAGGNFFNLTGFWSNLHSLWDAGGGFNSNSFSRPLSGASQTALNSKVAAIEVDYPYVRNVGAIPDPMNWAIESQTIAQTNSYVGITRGSAPSTNYLNAAQAAAEQRLAIGGQRLANLLNTIFASGDSLIVTNVGDGVEDEGTLRQALSLANSGDTIAFDVPLPATIHLQQGAIFFETDVTILGPGADKLVISGDGTNRVFHNDESTVTISGVTLSNGVSRSLGAGGAIANFGTLTISECTFKNNLARGPDGHGIGGGGGGAGGGAIFNDISSTLFVVNSTFSDNQTVGGGGHRSGGGSGGAFGGAIFNLNGSVTLSNCTFSANLAMGGTSGVTDDGELAGDGGSGINSFSGGSGFHDFPDGSDGNDAEDIGGGGGAAADGEQSTGVCDGGNGGHGGAGGFGGGGGVGGNGANGCVVVVDGDGGNGGNGGNGGDGGFGAGGAGAGVGGLPTGVGTLSGSDGIPGAGGLGAGSGVSTNGGGGAGFGGAIFTFLGSVQIVNCTIASNSAVGGGSVDHVADGTGIGGGIYNSGGDLEVLNTIIAGNVADSDNDVGHETDLGVDIVSDGHNLIGIGNGSSSFTNGVNGDLVGSTNAPLNAKLGPLANNGGPTFTIALLAGSPAIDAGSDSNCSPTDQRGKPRPNGMRCDIGAFEFNLPPQARCQDVTVLLISGCSTNVSVNGGSFDPDSNEPLTLSQSPAGPYFVGTNTVKLTVTDGFGATNSCTARVIVIDNIPPSITCPSNKTTLATSPAGAVVTFADPVASDNCSATVNCVPPSGSTFPIGDRTVVCTATDEAGKTDSCTFSIHVEGASEQLSDAGLVILGLGIDPKIKKNVLKKFQKIERQIDANHTRNACKQLHALQRQVELDLFKNRITTDQAIQLTTPMVNALTVLGCP